MPLLTIFNDPGAGLVLPRRRWRPHPAQQVESLQQGPRDRVVIRFDAGDEIVPDVQVTGDVVHNGNDTSLSFIVEQPVEAWMGPHGVRLRADDGAWMKPPDFFTGSLSTGLSLSAEDRINRAPLTLEADRR